MDVMADEDDMSPEEIVKAQKENCIFCKIITGEIPSKKVYEDDRMLAILDINPATKGHTLVMPKEHYPILPVIPPDIFKHLFKTTKYLALAIKKGMVVNEVTVFIANGAVAGQQSPHFLFHVIPNEGFDVDIPKGKIPAEDATKVTPPLRANMGAIMKQYLQREGKLAKEIPKETPREPKSEQPVQQSIQAPQQREDPPGQESESVQDEHARGYSKDDLAKVIMENPRLKELIMHDPEKLKVLIKTNKELAALFEGVNIDRLSQKLREFDKTDDKKEDKKDNKENKDRQDDKKDESNDDAEDDRQGHGNPEIDKIARLFS